MSWLPIVDGHADTLTRAGREGRTIGGRSERGQSDLGRLLEAGVCMQVEAVCPDAELSPNAAFRLTRELIEGFRNELRDHDGFLVETQTDLDRLRPGRVGFLLALEGGDALDGDPGRLRVLFRQGLRLIGLTWNGRNCFADGAGVTDGGGLTGAGRDLIVLAEELGVVVDLAHINDRGFWDAMAAAERPVVVSHANARALCDHPRNLTDAQLRAVAARGGLVGVNLYPPFLTGSTAASLDDVLRHIEHMVAVAGIDAVGFGLDYDGMEVTPADLPDVTALPMLIRALPRLGLDPREIAGLAGGNWLRVFRQILPVDQAPPFLAGNCLQVPGDTGRNPC